MSALGEPLHWSHGTVDIPSRGLDVRRAATPAELEALSRANAPNRFSRLEVGYRLRPLAKARYALVGEFSATVEQTCVVSLAEMTSELREEIRLELWPEEQTSDLPSATDPVEATELSVLDDLDVEPYGEDGILPVGRIVAELVALAVDPYPRRADAELPAAIGGGEDASHGKESPFAVLAAFAAKNKRRGRTGDEEA